MNVRKAQNWDRLAIVVSLAVITLVLMAQTMYASGAARVSGAAASGSLSFQATDTGDGGVGDATDTGDGDGGVGDATDTGDGGGGIGDATDTGDGGGIGDATDTGDGGGIGDATPTDDGPRGDKPIPPGQLKRRGIFGTVVGYVDGGVIIQTKFGNVTVLVEDATSYADGERFSALLDKSPVPSDATGTTDGSFRTVTALRVKGVPGKAKRKHLRAVVVDSASGTDDEDTLTILDDDGNEIELENDGASGTIDGEDTILLVQDQGDGEPTKVIGSIPSFSVDERLEKFRDKASPEKLARIEALFEKRAERIEARLLRLEDKARPGLKDKVRGARDKNKNKGRGASSGDDGDSGDGSSGGKGKPDDKGKPDKDEPKDKGKPDRDSSGGGGGKGKPDK